MIWFTGTMKGVIGNRICVGAQSVRSCFNGENIGTLFILLFMKQRDCEPIIESQSLQGDRGKIPEITVSMGERFMLEKLRQMEKTDTYSDGIQQRPMTETMESGSGEVISSCISCGRKQMEA